MEDVKSFEPLNLLLCSQLINTYNTTILGKMDLHMQEALLNEAQKKAEICATTNKQNEKEYDDEDTEEEEAERTEEGTEYEDEEHYEDAGK